MEFCCLAFFAEPRSNFLDKIDCFHLLRCRSEEKVTSGIMGDAGRGAEIIEYFVR